MTDKRILLINDDGTATVNGVKVRVVPEDALLWLHGEGEEFACPPERYFRGAPPAYWWRSVFRQKAAAIDLSGLPSVPERSADVSSDLNYWLDEMGIGK